MKILKYGIFVAVFSVLFFCARPLVGIRYAMSPSLPYKLFLSRPVKQITKNQYVTLEHPRSTLLVAKQIIGIAGDFVSVEGEKLLINGHECGTILKRSSSGIDYHAIATGKIPDGYVFAFAPHEESFDSRYQEFGLVKIEQIKERLWPLF